MPQITKEQIKQVINTIKDQTSSRTGEFSEAVTLLQGLLDQSEGEPVAHLRAKTSAVAWNSFELVPQDMGNAIPVYTHPAPFSPITADDITDDMVANFIRGHTDNMTYQKTFIAAVNAYLASRKPITADDITDEMVAAYHTTTSSSKEAVLRIVNAYLGTT